MRRRLDLIGCGIMAGIGAAINTGHVSRGDSVAVFGCGGVGNAAIAGSKLAGAHTIIAVDIDPRKLELATQLGATHTVNSRETDAVEAIRDLTGGFGVDVAIEAVGIAGDLRTGVLCARSCGDGCVGRSSESGDAGEVADAGDIRARRFAEVVVVRGLPADA